ncbi:MAG: hypothetical protein LBH98_09045 [Chitinispirillales bacterium]|jgi:hypothetical protein|nr:hypothetical protein [Chitinispirillales bacterium]
MRIPPPPKLLVLQELEVLENFLRETPSHGIAESTNYISEWVKLNIEKIKGTNEEILEPRFAALLENVEKLLMKQISGQNQYSSFDDLRKNILFDFQCKTNLDETKISELLQSAKAKNL